MGSTLVDVQKEDFYQDLGFGTRIGLMVHGFYGFDRDWFDGTRIGWI
jgi:hypothetical protein